MEHHYKAFGLNIRSEFTCPELLPGFAPPDMTIEYDSLSRILPGATAVGVCFQAAPGKLLLTWEGATYLVCEGSSILVDPMPRAAAEVVRLFLLESAFGALLHQRRILPLHGSAVMVKQGAIVFLGGSASGKSSLAAALRQLGYKVLADEISAVYLDDKGSPRIAPAYPQLNLWNDVIEILGEKTPAVRPVREGLQKYALPVGDSFHERTLPLDLLYVLKGVNESSCALEDIKGTEKMRYLMTHTHQRGFLKGLGLLRNHFEMCARMAKLTPMKLATHPKAATRLREFVSMVEKDLSG